MFFRTEWSGSVCSFQAKRLNKLKQGQGQFKPVGKILVRFWWAETFKYWAETFKYWTEKEQSLSINIVLVGMLTCIHFLPPFCLCKSCHSWSAHQFQFQFFMTPWLSFSSSAQVASFVAARSHGRLWAFVIVKYRLLITYFVTCQTSFENVFRLSSVITRSPQSKTWLQIKSNTTTTTTKLIKKEGCI